MNQEDAVFATTLLQHRDERARQARSDAWYFAALHGERRRRHSPPKPPDFWNLSPRSLSPRQMRRIAVLLMSGGLIVLVSGTHPLIEWIAVALLP